MDDNCTKSLTGRPSAAILVTDERTLTFPISVSLVRSYELEVDVLRMWRLGDSGAELKFDQIQGTPQRSAVMAGRVFTSNLAPWMCIQGQGEWLSGTEAFKGIVIVIIQRVKGVANQIVLGSAPYPDVSALRRAGAAPHHAKPKRQRLPIATISNLKVRPHISSAQPPKCPPKTMPRRSRPKKRASSRLLRS